MRFKTQIDRFNSDLWGYHIVVPDQVAQAFLDAETRRVVCTLNGVLTFQCALMPNKNGFYFININKANRKKLNLEIGSEVEVYLEQDESKYGLPVPEEFQALLELDDEGSQLFHQLTPGKQRTLLFLIGKPKTSNTRLKKAIVVIEYLKSTKGKLDFKELNQAFKDYNEQ